MAAEPRATSAPAVPVNLPRFGTSNVATMRAPKSGPPCRCSARARTETIPTMLRRRGVSRRVYMNFAVRRLLIIACVASALPLSAQTTKKTSTPVTVSTSPSGAPADVPAADQAPTVTVSADTDRDVNNTRAMRLSLDDAIHTMLQKNIGVQIQRYDLQMTAEGIMGAYNIFDPFAGATISRTSSQRPALNAFTSSGGGTTNADVFLRDVIPTGGSFEVSTNNQRFTSTGNGTTISPG